MDARDFNNSLPQAQQKTIVDFKTFKNANYPTGGMKLQSNEELIATIQSVIPRGNGLEVVFENKRTILCCFDGTYVRYNCNGIVSSVGGVENLKGFENQHIRLRIEDKSIFLEKFIAIATDILQNKMPLSYSGWEANVMDGSGSIKTAMNEYVNCRSNIIEPTSLRMYHEIIRNRLQSIQHIKIKDLRIIDIQCAVNLESAKGLSRRTIKNGVDLLKATLEFFDIMLNFKKLCLPKEKPFADSRLTAH